MKRGKTWNFCGTWKQFWSHILEAIMCPVPTDSCGLTARIVTNWQWTDTMQVHWWQSHDLSHSATAANL